MKHEIKNLEHSAVEIKIKFRKLLKNQNLKLTEEKLW